jgi:subtilisin family serine protease
MFVNMLSTKMAEKLGLNHDMMNVPAMWGRTKGKGIKIAVLDTGRPHHPDIKVVRSKCFVPGEGPDKNGHATHCSGIINAIAQNGIGIAGIAPESELYTAQVLAKKGGGRTKWIIDAIHWAVDEIGVDLISMSLGMPGRAPRQKHLEKACNYAVEQGVALFAATGNEGTVVGQPACFDSVIAVGAIDFKKRKANFSNHGHEVDFVAGGVGVLSCYLNKGYARLSGTSMACPAVAGIGALILAKHKIEGEKVAPGDLREKIRKIAFDLGAVGQDDFYGYGMPLFKRP